ncbi:hypothetical protein GCM10017044_11290 [Kordiimonas sediminis]|uniref:Glycosyltransferase 2-like domain-containing protein n=1 Tax=Kordiimonas sediminis TaxID=1735581 RepID=A0A919E6C8_9PROT|nr:glycosyltransferase family A protein [Kordiimonas sediminis]GHF18507.1 hypothetical protein GCM10017044_11290 [Kordiimonas sediminis]
MTEGSSKLPLGIVIPGYGHPKFLAEAIISACTQEIDQPVKVVVVDDGCRFKETADVVRNLMPRYPGTLHYIRQENTRLPGARNTGIKFLLDHFPDMDAIFFLDADNRIKPYALASYRRALGDDPAVGWAYPDITFFGLNRTDAGYDIRETSPQYSVLRHMVGNISEAGSMVRADMLRQGVLFDEDMKFGFEDWDFWLSAIAAGFVGTRVKDPGFMYRRRPESMLSDARRGEDALLATMYSKHKALFNPRFISHQAHLDAPAFAIVEIDTGVVELTGDPLVEGKKLWRDDFLDLLRNYERCPREYFIPDQVIFLTSAMRQALQKEMSYLRWIFWNLSEEKLDVRACSVVPGTGMSKVTHPREKLNQDIVFLAATSAAVLSKSDKVERYKKTTDMMQSAYILPKALPDIATLSDDGTALLSSFHDLRADIGAIRQPIRHFARRFAGPAKQGVCEKLLEPFCSEEGRQPYPLATSVNRQRLSIVVSENFLDMANGVSVIASDAVRIQEALFPQSDLQVAIEFDRPATLNRLVGHFEKIQNTDILPFPTDKAEGEYLLYLGSRIENKFPLHEKESASIAARYSDILIILGPGEHLGQLGEARHYGVKGVLFLDGSYLDQAKVTASLPKILAYEHAIDTIVCHDRGFISHLTAEGVPPGKIMSRQQFFDKFHSSIC